MNYLAERIEHSEKSFLERLAKYDRFGTKDELLALLFQFLSPHEYKKIEDVKTICIHHSYTFGNSFNGMIYLLELLGLIKIENGRIKTDVIIVNYESENFFSNIIVFEKLFTLLKEADKLEALFNYKSTQLDNETLTYYIKETQIPFSLNSIKKFLITTEFFTKQENIPGTYFINPLFKDFFSSIIISTIKKISVKKKMTLQQLKNIQSLQNEYGEQAEKYVLNFELARVTNHPLKYEIKQISEEFVNAGYDIQSFNSADSVVNDRFIEVKSYSGNEMSFYWSKNEVEMAKEIADCYFLYLVDRSKIIGKDYKPFIIKDPYKNLFLNDKWQKNTETYFVWKHI